MSPGKPTVFISYSHKDERWKERLVQHLRVLGGERDFDVWDDQRIAAGEAWKAAIERALETASVAVLLVSVDFLDSRFIRGEEVPKLLRRRERERLPVVPVIVRPCAWKDIDWLSGMQARPKGGKPLSGGTKHDIEENLTRIAREISGLIPHAPRPAAIEAAPDGVDAGPEGRVPATAVEAPAAAAAAAAALPPALPGPTRELDRPVITTVPLPPGSPAPVATPASPVASPPRAVSPASGASMGIGASRVPQSGRRSPPTRPPSARGKRRVALLAVVALGLAMAVHAGYRRFFPRHVPIVLDSFEFETVVVDDRGEVRERRKLQGQSFREDLGGGVSLEMVVIPGGTFKMGSPTDENGRSDAEGPQHAVTVAPFLIGKFEVTQAQWRAVARLPRAARGLDAEPSRFKGDKRPVERISWHDAIEFCLRLTRKTGRTYRLPSEAEWEYAARAGTATPFVFGPTIRPALVNYDGNYPYGSAPKGQYREQTIAVGSLGFANAFGLFGVHGSVWEWTQDVGHDSYEGAPRDGSAWESGGDSPRRVLRGGSWFSSARDCRSAYRNWLEPEYRSNSLGLRVLCAVSRTR